ncbi:hypothetical protein DID75_05365 [Candidatus Marinamargulisbacteria bacterium SCGC AG-410-N11]|nr:hypothetical protein DID75_05365 [Candidatus Marinamargulisbacteria bacterium SCGC AG-410-N11]
MGISKSYLKYLTYFILFVAFLVSLNIAFRRYQFETFNNNVELTVSYNEIEKLSFKSDLVETPKTIKRRYKKRKKIPDQIIPLETKSFLKLLKKKSQVTTIAVEEDTLDTMVNKGKLTVFKGSELINLNRVGHVNQYFTQHLYKQIDIIRPERFYLFIERKKDYERIRNFFVAEYGKKNVKRIGQYNILEVLDTEESLYKIGLGFSRQLVNELKSLGFKILVHLKNSDKTSRTVVRQKFYNCTQILDNNSIIIFDGHSILGYPNQLDFVQEKMIGNKYFLGLIEFSEQKGRDLLAKSLSSYIIRVHDYPLNLFSQNSRDVAVSRYIRASKERGVKVLYLHPFFKMDVEGSIIDYNIEYFNQIAEGISQVGLNIDVLESRLDYNYQPASNLEVLLISIAIIITFLYFLNYFFRLSLNGVLLCIIFFVGVYYILALLGYVEFWVQCIATIAAILFPTLALILKFPNEEDTIVRRFPFLSAVIYIFSMLSFTLLGALLIVGLLSDIDFLMGIRRFIGVKIAYIIPLLFICIYFYLRPHRISSLVYVLKRIFNAPIRTVVFVSILASLSFVIILLIRSGNYFSFKAFLFETQFRTLLEDILYVRPRTKEFLIGYPFLLLAYIFIDSYISRQWIWFFNLLGGIALISVINSFCHIHTPIMVSSYRTCLGILLGVVVGFIYMIILKLAIRFFKKFT